MVGRWLYLVHGRGSLLDVYVCLDLEMTVSPILLIWDLKEPVRMTTTLAMTTLSASREIPLSDNVL